MSIYQHFAFVSLSLREREGVRVKSANCLFLLVFTLILTFSPWEKGTAWAYHGEWTYRRPVTVTGSTSGAQTNYQVAVDPGIYDNTGLVGSWHFSEGSGATAFDMSGNGNNGTLTNGPTWTAGRFGNALSLDGINDYLEIADNSSLNFGTGDFTIETWFNSTTAQNSYWQAIISKHNISGSRQGPQLTLCGPSGQTPNVYFEAWSGGTPASVTSNQNIRDGQWHHVVGVKTPSELRIYIDGNLKGTSSHSLGSVSTTVPLRIGNMSNTSNYMTGRVDEVKISSRALTLAEITERYNGGSPKVRHDYADIRFANSLDQELPHWQETDSKFWVRVDNIPASPGAATIYEYYANPSATTVSNGNNTFDFFDDFDDGIVNTSKWDVGTNTYVKYVWENSGLFAITGTDLNADESHASGKYSIYGTGAVNTVSEDGVISGWLGKGLRSVNTFDLSKDWAIESFLSFTFSWSGGDDGAVTGLSFISDKDNRLDMAIRDSSYGEQMFYTKEEAGVGGGNILLTKTITSGSKYKLKYIWRSGLSSNKTFYVDNDSGNVTTTFTSANARLGLFGNVRRLPDQIDAQYDHIFARKYTSPEPGASVGGEELPFPPSAPSNLIGSFVDSVSADRLKLEWMDNSGNENGFTLQRSTDSFVTFTNVNLGASPGTGATDYIDTGLSPNTTCWYQIMAYNGIGSSGWVGMTTQPGGFATRASVPTSGTVTNRTTNSISVDWNPNGNPDGTAYIVERATSSDFGGTITAPDESGNYTATFQNLTPNTFYWLRVKARNHAGFDTSYFNYNSTTTLLSPPANVQFSGVWYSSAALTWTSPDPASGHVLEWSSTADPFTIISSSNSNVSVNSLAAAGLGLNATYYFRVGAKNVVGDVSYSVPIPTATLANAPLPAATSLSGVGPTTITANWIANGNPSPQTTYQTQASTTSNFSLVNQEITTPDESGNYIGLISQTTYFLRVRALNHSGIPTAWVSLGSTATIVTVSISTTDYTVPATVLQGNDVVLFKLNLATDGSTVTWTSLALQQLGSAVDSDIAEARVYRDNPLSSGTFDPIGSPDADTPISLVGTRFTSGSASLTILSEAVSSASQNFWIVCRLNSAATLGNTVQLRIAGVNSFGFAPGIWQVQGPSPATSGAANIQDNTTVVSLTGTSVAPIYIPKGTSSVALLKINANADIGTASLASLVLTRTGTATDSDVAKIKIFRDNTSSGTPGLYDPADIQLNTLDETGFTGSTKLVTIDTDKIPQITETVSVTLFIVTDIAAGAATDNTFGVKIAQNSHVMFSSVLDSANGNPLASLESSQLIITNPPNILNAAITNYPAPATGTQGQKIPMTRLVMSVNQDFARWTGLRVDLNGSELAGNVKEVQLYKDNDSSSGFSSGDGAPVSTAVFQGTTANLDFTVQVQTITITPATYFLIYHLNPLATANNTVSAIISGANYLSATTLNTTVTVPGPLPIVSGPVNIQTSIDTVTVSTSIPQPVPASVIEGNASVAMAAFRVSVNDNAATFTGLRLDKHGSCDDNDISAIKVWRDTNASSLLETGQDDLVSSTFTFFNGTVNVNLSPQQNVPVTPAYQDYFVSLTFNPDAGAGKTCGLTMASPEYFSLILPDVVTGNSPAAFPFQTQTLINEYADTVYVSTGSPAPADTDIGSQNAPLLKFVMRTDFATAGWSSVRLERLGTVSSFDLGLIKLWRDRDGSGTYNNADEPPISSAIFQANVTTVTLNVNPSEIIVSSSKTYFVTADVTSAAIPNRTFGLSLSNTAYFLIQSPNMISSNTFPIVSGLVAINEPPSEVATVPLSLVPSQISQGDSNVPFLYLTLRTLNYTAYWTNIKFDRTGDGTDQDIAKMRIYSDDGDGSFEPSTQDTLILTVNNPFTNNQATLTFSPQTITRSEKKYFITVDIGPVAKSGGSIGLEINNSSYLGFQAPDYGSAITFGSNQSLIQPTVDIMTATAETVSATLRQGEEDKVVGKISLKADNNAIIWNALQLNRSGTLPGSHISAISVWRDSGNGTFDSSDVLTGTAKNPFTLTPSPLPQGEGGGEGASVTFTAPQVITTSSQTYFVTVSLNRLATVGKTVGLGFADFTAFVVTAPDIVTAGPWQSNSITIADYPDVLTVKPTTLEIEAIHQGQEAALGRFDLNINEDDAELIKLKIRKAGAIADTQISGARLYLDTDGNKIWEKETDKLISGPVTFAAGQANFSFSPPFNLTSSTVTMFLTYSIPYNATVGRTAGFIIQDVSYLGLQGVDTVSGAYLPFASSLLPIKDARVPTKPKVITDSAYIGNTTQLHFLWDSNVFSGTIQDAEYAIGTSSTSTDVKTWTKIGNNKDITITDLTLEHGKTYYVKIMTKSDSGLYSDAGVSMSLTVDTIKPVMTTAPEVKKENEKIILSWLQGQAGPSRILGYKIEERNANTAVWSVITSTTAQAQRSEDRSPKTEDRNPITEDRSPISVLGPLLSAPLINGNSYAIGEKLPGTYFYRVKAVNGAGAESDPSPASRVVVGQAPDAIISDAFCYPNPFDSRQRDVNIVYTLNQDTDTELIIYDLLGSKVWSRTYAQGQEGGWIGTNTVTWNGTDSSAQKVPFDVYVCLIKPKAGGETKIKIAVIH